MTKGSIIARLEAVEQLLGRDKPALLITYKDGHRATMSAGEAIELIKEAGATVAKVEDVRGANGMIADLLTGLCGED